MQSEETILRKYFQQFSLPKDFRQIVTDFSKKVQLGQIEGITTRQAQENINYWNKIKKLQQELDGTDQFYSENRNTLCHMTNQFKRQLQKRPQLALPAQNPDSMPGPENLGLAGEPANDSTLAYRDVSTR